MKKRILNILSILLASTLIVGCNTKKKNNSSDNSDSGNNSSGVTLEWKSGLQTLMMQYCGEVLPYAEGIGSNYSYEVEDDILYIDDSVTTKLNITNYYVALEAAGWTSTLNASGGHNLTDEYGDTYYEVYKVATTKRTNFVQYYLDDTYGNSIACFYTEMVDQKTADTNWSVKDQEALQDALSFVPVFMQFGSDYTWETDRMYAALSDSYVNDLSADYNALLSSNGFTLVTSGEYQGAYSKTTSEGHTAYALAYYEQFNGNSVVFLIEANQTTTNSWPSAFLSSITDGTEYTIPSFAGTTYSYYTFNGHKFVSTATTTDLSESYEEALENAGLFIEYFYGFYAIGAYPWEENFYIGFDTEYSSDYSSVVGFSIEAYKTTPESTFSATWPATQISEFLGTGMPEILEAVKSSTKDFKYASYDADTESKTPAYFMVSAIDDGEPGVNAIEDSYVEAYFNNAWYIDDSAYEKSGYYVEDAQGKVCIQFYSYNGLFTCFIYEGSGKTHTPELTLNRSTANAKPDSNLQLTAYRSMITDAVEFSSSDESIATVDHLTGLVHILSTAPLDSQVTITATAGTYEATCVITVKESIDVTIGTSDVPTKYDSTATARTIKGLDFMVCNVMLQDGKIQMKKNSTNLYNTTAFDPIDSITFVGANKEADTTTFTVFAGNASNNLEAVAATQDGANLVYNLNGATFFQIKNGTGVFTCSEIIFTF